MPSLTRTEIIGHVGGDPELRFTPKGSSVASFNVAVNRRYTFNDETKEATDWFNVTVWGKLAESCNQFVKKGMLVYVAGRVELHKWQNTEGQDRSSLQLHAANVLFLSQVGGNKEPVSEEEELPY